MNILSDRYQHAAEEAQQTSAFGRCMALQTAVEGFRACVGRHSRPPMNTTRPWLSGEGMKECAIVVSYREVPLEKIFCAGGFGS